MGREFFSDPELSDLAERCSNASGVDLRHLLCTAGDDELKLTQNAQPALLFTGLALARLMARRGIEPRAAAGHSVGEYCALVVAGALTPEEGVRVVAERGRAMARAAGPGEGGLVAVLGLPAVEVERVLDGLDAVWPANYNTPTQTVVGGRTAPLQLASEALLAAGARRALPLNVAAAFHTPLMAPAADGLRAVLEQVEWRRPAFAVVANLDAEPHLEPERIAGVLSAQLSSAVRWSDCIARLCAMGCTTFYELGPKRALSGMMRELAPQAEARPVSTPAAVDELSPPG